MTVLSDQDIRKELGENIYIYPFSDSNLKGASYNLTASHLAWSLKNKKSIFRSEYKDQKDVIVIEPGDTGLIETFETIWVSQKIAGSYHSRVTQVTQGTGHIGTTLDPNYIGPSLIAIHNHSVEDIVLSSSMIKKNNDSEQIKFGTPFVTLSFNYLQTPSSQQKTGNSAGRREVLSKVGISLNSEEEAFIDEKFRNEDKALLKKMQESEPYKEVIKDVQKLKHSQRSLGSRLKDDYLATCITGSIFSIVVVFYVMIILFQSSFQSKSWYNSILGFMPEATFLSFVLFASKGIEDKLKTK